MIVKDKSSLPWNHGWNAYIEQTGATLQGHTWQYLKQVVGAHLDKHGLNVGDRELYLHNAVCLAMARDGKGGKCINGHKISHAQTQTRAYQLDPRMPANLKGGKPGYDGKAWGVWHLSAIDGKLTPRFATELVRRIGCGSCRSHATRYLQAHPLTEGMPQHALFAWTVNFHSHVSRSIGKPVVSLEEAKKIWGAE
jgi:hypothetical protein